MVSIVLLHKLLSDHVCDVQQYLQTIFVHGLAPLMECWQNCGTRVPELSDLCLAVLWQTTAPDLHTVKRIRNCSFLAFLPCGSASVSTSSVFVGS